MDIAILSVSLNVYSTARIAEEFEKAGHYVEHVDHTKCSVQLGGNRPQIFFGADNIRFLKVSWLSSKFRFFKIENTH